MSKFGGGDKAQLLEQCRASQNQRSQRVNATNSNRNESGLLDCHTGSLGKDHAHYPDHSGNIPGLKSRVDFMQGFRLAPPHRSSVRNVGIQFPERREFGEGGLRDPE